MGSVDMVSTQTNEASEAGDLIVNILETLEAHGQDPDEYLLYETLNAATAEKLIDESDNTVEIRFTVEGVRLAVTSEHVRVLSDSHELYVD